MNLDRIILISFFTFILAACNNGRTKDLTRHYDEVMLRQFEKICEQQKSRDSGTYLLDSLYNTFPYISITDQYRYYNFKQTVFELVRFGDRSYDTAIAYLDSMIALIESNGLQVKMKEEYLNALGNRGEYRIRTERYDEAIKDIFLCKQLNGKAGDSCLMAENTKTLSNIAVKQSNFPLAASLVKEALTLVATCKKDDAQYKRMQRYLDDLGFIYASMNKFDSALPYHLAAEKYVLDNKQLMMGHDTLFPYVALENIYGNIGEELGIQRKFKEAEVYLKQAIHIDQDILHDSLHLAIAQYWLGTFYLEDGRINEAEIMAQRSTLQANNLETGFRGGLLVLKISIARQKKQYREKTAYGEQFQLIQDSLNNSTIGLLKKSPFIEYERLDKKYQLELLEKDNRNQKNRSSAAIVIGVLSILLVILSLFFLQRLRRVMKKRAIAYKKLLASEIALKETMEQKEMAQKELQEKELFAQEMRLQLEFNEAIIQQRQQISDDMHDELSSSLAALKFYSEDIKKRMQGTTVEKPIAEIADEIKSVYENARRYMHNLKSNNHETGLSLTGFLKEIQRKFAEKNLLKVTLKIDEEDIKASLSPLQHNQLYHIIKEAVSNIIKHANATAITISISMDRFKCHFSIADNGRGFNKEKITPGIGINSMMNRIKELDGEIDIVADKKGTRINGYFLI